MYLHVRPKVGIVFGRKAEAHEKPGYGADRMTKTPTETFTTCGNRLSIAPLADDALHARLETLQERVVNAARVERIKEVFLSVLSGHVLGVLLVRGVAFAKSVGN